jgi:moderate conductance mechanosensitive channel
MRFLRQVLVALIFALAIPIPGWGEGLIGDRRSQLAEQALVGRWEAPVGRLQLVLRFYSDGRYVLGEEQGRYAVLQSELELTGRNGNVFTYGYELQENFLILRGGDLGQEVRFVRAAADDAALQGYFRWLFDLSFSTAEERFFRILTIIAIVALSVLFVNLLRVVSSFLIFSEVGPLRYVYRRHKVKTRTIHSVVLNFIKYIIYFTALGHVLAELGINYATYFASLSVVGLAIGFGSQGLVQDIVTGFFLIFDGQFGVGDMVEISGQTGVVEELGLRTTRLRTYMGQTVVIPNRNIALVANYSKGAVRAFVDVPMKDEETMQRMAGKVTLLLSEMARQFEGTLLKAPQDLGAMKLRSGELYRRWVLEIWPQQHQLLVDQQVVPRVRELFEREGVELPNNRVVVFFRLPEKKPVSVWRNRLARKKKAGGDAGDAPAP